MKGTIADWERDRFSRKTADEITDLPETDEPAHTAPPSEDDPVELLRRSVGGWWVELRLTADGRVCVAAQQGEDAPIQAVVVEPEHALDAFQHPYCYLPR